MLLQSTLWWLVFVSCFFFNDTATTEIYTLSLHDALPISRLRPHAARPQLRPLSRRRLLRPPPLPVDRAAGQLGTRDRKSTRLNSSHANISYAVFCLKKKITYTSRRCPSTRYPPISYNSLY